MFPEHDTHCSYNAFDKCILDATQHGLNNDAFDITYVIARHCLDASTDVSLAGSTSQV